MHTPIRRSLQLAVLPLLLAACAREVPTSDARVVVTLQRALSGSDVARVTASVSAPDIQPALSSDLVASGGQWIGTLMSIPEGTGRTVEVTAYDGAGTALYGGAATNVAISDGQVTLVSILAQQLAAPTPYANAAPKIVSVIVSSAQPGAGDVVQLAASAVDADGADGLTYQWTSSGGSFSDGAVPNPSWTAPSAPGAQTLTLNVSDAKGATAGISFALDVAATSATGGVGLTAGVNTWPVVALVHATPTRAAVGEPFAITTTASDADGDPLGYAWTASCGGTFSDPGTSNPTFTASSAPADGVCSLVVAVTDGRGGQSTGRLSINVLAPVQANFAPDVQLTFQSVFSTSGGGSVIFRIQASDPEGEPLSFGWTTTGGTLTTSALSASVSQAQLTAPDCALGAQVRVTASVSDGGGATSLRAFTVNITGCPMGSAPATPGESCLAIKQHIPTSTSGSFHLGAAGASYTAECDMALDGGGWTVFFAGLTGSAHSTRSFKDADDCPAPATSCLRHLPAAATTSTWVAALCNDGSADRAVKFQPSQGALGMFKAGARLGYQQLHNAAALTPGVDPLDASILFTGGNNDPEWVISRTPGAQSVFTASYPLAADYDYCNGVPASGTKLRLLYR